MILVKNNSNCADLNHFDADNLSIAEWMGKDKTEVVKIPKTKTLR